MSWICPVRLAAPALLACIGASCAGNSLPIGPTPRVRLSEVIPQIGIATVPSPPIPRSLVSVPIRGPRFIREGQREVDTLSPQPLYVIDGAIVGRRRDGTIDRLAWRRVLRELDPASIESIEVLKEVPAIRRFGPEGKNGVVLFQTRRPAAALRKSRTS